VALLSEAFRLVGEGVVSPQDLDKTLSDGLGLRWSFMGPFQTIELNAPGGIPDYCARYGDFSAARPPIRPRPPCGTRRTSPGSWKPGGSRPRKKRLRGAPPGATSA
jgi:3-hydroxyacyl-CoA dehydrogenase-like protein